MTFPPCPSVPINICLLDSVRQNTTHASGTMMCLCYLGQFLSRDGVMTMLDDHVTAELLHSLAMPPYVISTP
jgi:hypothetical protein